MFATIAVGRPIRPAALFSEASPHRLRFLRRRGPSASVPGSKSVSRRRAQAEAWESLVSHTRFSAATALQVAIRTIRVAAAIEIGPAGCFFLLDIRVAESALSQRNIVGTSDSLVSPRHLDGFAASRSCLSVRSGVVDRWKKWSEAECLKIRFKNPET